MDLLQYAAAALIAAGSALVLRAVWMADLEAETPPVKSRAVPVARRPELADEWREAA